MAFIVKAEGEVLHSYILTLYRIVILPVILYDCEMWSHFKGKHRLRMLRGEYLDLRKKY
jgi:hypothetical protein